MRRLLLLISMLLPLSAALAANGRVPDLNVKAICKTRDADAKLFRSTTGQSVDECVHDEENARQQLNSLWTSTAAPVRNRCESEGPFELNREEIDRGGWFSPGEVSRWMAEKPEEFASALLFIWRRLNDE